MPSHAERWPAREPNETEAARRWPASDIVPALDAERPLRSAAPRQVDHEPLTGVQVGPLWPSQIDIVAVPRAADQRQTLRQFFRTDAVKAVRCGFGLWVCYSIGLAPQQLNLVAVPTAKALQSELEGTLYGPALFLAGSGRFSDGLASPNDAQRAKVYGAYDIAVTELMARADSDVDFRRSLDAAED